MDLSYGTSRSVRVIRPSHWQFVTMGEIRLANENPGADGQYAGVLATSSPLPRGYYVLEFESGNRWGVSVTRPHALGMEIVSEVDAPA